MDSVRWDNLRITGMENGWLVDPDEVGTLASHPSMTVFAFCMKKQDASS